VRVEITPLNTIAATDVQRSYTAVFLFKLGVDGCGWMKPHTTSLPPEWRKYSIYKKLDGLREETGQMQIFDRNRSSNLILSSL